MFEKLFHLKEHNTDVTTEIIAGLTTFMTMAYILVVNPLILSGAGMDMFAVFTATALSAAIATLFMAFAANLPIALASGMGLNAFFAAVVVGQMGYSWQFALTAVFIEGLIFIVLTLTNLREAIINCIPPSLKNAISAGIGLFIAFIGLQNSGIIVADANTMVKLGNITSSSTLLTIVGILLIGTMLVYKINGALLIGILLTSLIGIPLGITTLANFDTSMLFTVPSIAPTFLQFEWAHVLSYDMFIVVLTFLFVDLFDTVGTLVGVATKGNLLDKDGKIPKAKRAFMADAVGTTGGAMLGTSTVTSFVESTSGVAEGGRTGLTSLVVAILFLLSLFFSPFFLLVPGQATAAALVVVGIFMISPITTVDFNDYVHGIPAFFAIVMMPLAYSISEGIIFGLTSFVFLAIVSKRTKEVTPLAIILVVLFILKYALVNG